jgi:hypothetical protein
MNPSDLAAAMFRIERIADYQINRDAIAPGVVKRHCRVLQADSAVSHRQHRLAFNLCISVRHRKAELFQPAALPPKLQRLPRHSSKNRGGQQKVF